jgi:hypothetical protein
MDTPTKHLMRRGRLPAGGLSPRHGVDDLQRTKRPHLHAGTPHRSSCRRASTTGPSTKVRLGATHHTLLARHPA